MKTTKAEKREKLKANNRKMIVTNRSIFTLVRTRKNKYEKKSNTNGNDVGKRRSR